MTYEIHYSDKNGNIHTTFKASVNESLQAQKHIEAMGGQVLHIYGRPKGARK